MPLVGFEPTIAAGERPHFDDLHRAATRTGISYLISNNKQLTQLYLYQVYSNMFRPYRVHHQDGT